MRLLWGLTVIGGLDGIAGLLADIRYEIMLFAAVGLLLGGIDDLVVDFVYLARRCWRRLFVYTRHRPMTTATLPRSRRPGTLAVFVPAWQEEEVIAPMLRAALRQWGDGDYRIFVGVYPNDPETLEAVAAIACDHPAVQPVVNLRPGPTTKADCLNGLWRAMLAWEEERGRRAKAIVLHDAEDVVHPDELRLLDRMIDGFALVQLPVLPLVSQHSQWVSGHYCDEFSESHGKYLCVREALGAAMPSAGVGCAFSRTVLDQLVGPSGGPFDPASLTEDYELGLRIAEAGGRGVFVRMRDTQGELVCTREHFPDTIDAAVRQKARWTVGIALSGWDRLGWRGGLAERWMRLRDRRAALAALILFAAYLSLILSGPLWLIEALTDWSGPTLPTEMLVLLSVNGMLMLWRMLVRALFVCRDYGWRQAVLSIPRTIVANYLSILAARRAMGIYVGLLRGRALHWDKTRHRFPAGDMTS